MECKNCNKLFCKYCQLSLTKGRALYEDDHIYNTPQDAANVWGNLPGMVDKAMVYAGRKATSDKSPMRRAVDV